MVAKLSLFGLISSARKRLRLFLMFRLPFLVCQVLAMDAEIAKSNAVPANAPSDFQDGQLTAAERRIARYVAYGFSNKQISTYLDISVRTVENHISHILGKKRFTSRVEIARHVLKDSRNESEMGPQVRFSNGPVHGDRL